MLAATLPAVALAQSAPQDASARDGKSIEKPAQKRTRAAPAKKPGNKKDRFTPSEVVSVEPPPMPPSAAQVYPVPLSLPEWLDPDLALSLQPRLALSMGIRPSAASQVVVTVPFEPAQDLPMESFLAWARDSVQPASKAPLAARQSAAHSAASKDTPSIFASLTNWLRESTKSIERAPLAPPTTQVAVAPEPRIEVPHQPAKDLPMAHFVAWAEEAKPAPTPVEVVVPHEPAPEMTMASLTEWARENAPSVAEVEVVVPHEPAPAVTMASLAAWAGEAVGSVAEVEVVVPHEPAPDMTMASLAAWAREDAPSVAEVEVVVPHEPAPEVTMASLAAWAGEAVVSVAEVDVVVPHEPAPDMTMASLAAWAREDAPSVAEVEVVVPHEPTPEMTMDSLTAWAIESAQSPAEPKEAGGLEPFETQLIADMEKQAKANDEMAPRGELPNVEVTIDPAPALTMESLQAWASEAGEGPALAEKEAGKEAENQVEVQVPLEP
ncbi:MAG: hypothetical protein RIR70_1384, partial [Pseudomonadota bacterium]